MGSYALVAFALSGILVSVYLRRKNKVKLFTVHLWFCGSSCLHCLFFKIKSAGLHCFLVNVHPFYIMSLFCV